MAESENYDLVVIGGGPGGYVASVRAAQLGLKVACVERDPRLGGVCLREGCIPSKALLDSSEYYFLARRRFSEHGIACDGVSLDLRRMMARKDHVVTTLTDSVAKLLQRHRVEVIHGSGRLAGPTEVEVSVSGGGEMRRLSARSIVLASGSRSVELENLPVDEKRIVSSSGALALEAVPRRLAVVGGGYIGLELGSVWSRLGAEVTVIEALPRIASGLDLQIGRYLERALKKQGLSFRVGTRVEGVGKGGDELQLSLREEDGGQETYTCDCVLVAVGRRPATEGLGLESAGIAIAEATGQVMVDENYRTTVSTVYAIGDLVAGPMLAHKASAEGTAVAEIIAGKPGEVNYDAIPSVVYTAPEVAAVGLSEEQLKTREIPYRTGAFPFGGVGRAQCLGETDGMVKVLSHAESDRLLGVHIIGPRASDLIAECALALEFSGSAEDLARTVHAHPTFAEAVREAAAVAGSA